MARILKNRWLIAAAVVVLIGAVLFMGLSMSAKAATGTTALTGQVTLGDIQSTVLSSAALQPAADLTLTFGVAGTIDTVSIKPGDHVTKGQVIATLNTSDLQLAVTQAQASFSSAQAKLESVKAGAAAKDIANAEGTLRAAQAKLDGLKLGPTASDLASAQAGLASAQAKLASVKAGATALDIANAQASLSSAKAKLASVKAGATALDIANAESTLASAKAKLDTLKLGASAGDIAAATSNLNSAKAKLQALKAPPTSVQLSAAQLKVLQAQTNLTKVQSSSSVSKQQAEIALDQANHALLNAQDKYNSVAGPLLDDSGNLKSGLSQTQIDNYNTTLRALQDAEDNYRKADLSLNDARLQETQNLQSAQAQLNDANIQLSTLLEGPTVSDLAAAQASVDQAQNSLDKLKAPPTASDLASAQASVDQAKNNLEKLKAPPTASDIATAQASVDQAQNALDKLKAGATDTDIKAAAASVAQAQASFEKLKAPPTAADQTAAQTSVDQAKNNLDALKAGPAATDLSSAQATVDQAKANLDQAKSKLDGSGIKAPFDGVVSDVPVQAGQLVSANTVVAEMVDNSAYHLDMNVSETDISRVKTGLPVDVTFDALSGEVYTGTITFVSPKASVQQGVVSYMATVTLDPKAAGGNLRPGMSATASAIVDQHSNVLLVPNRTIRTVGRQKMVSLIGPGGTQIPIVVQTGITNDTSTEIVSSNTQLRDGDVLAIPTTTSTNRAATNTGLFNVGGAGGGVRRGP